MGRSSYQILTANTEAEFLIHDCTGNIRCLIDSLNYNRHCELNVPTPEITMDAESLMRYDSIADT
jgi:hypothetical protein